MSRISKFGKSNRAIWVALVALTVAPATATAQKKISLQLGQAATADAASVRSVLVRGSGSDLVVEIQTSGAISPETQSLTGPDRIVIDFPGATPARELHAVQVNRGPLKAVRPGLFFTNPPITRVVLDLAEPRAYHISYSRNSVVLRLGDQAEVRQEATAPAPKSGPAPAASLQNAVLAGSQADPHRLPMAQTGSLSNPTNGPNPPAFKAAAPNTRQVISGGLKQTIIAPATIAQAAPTPTLPPPMASANPPGANPSLGNAQAGTTPSVNAAAGNDATVLPPAKSVVNVTYADGLLSIHSDRATLAEVLYEIQRQTHAEIAIPAGAEQEQVYADIGPAPAREALGALLNGAPYNFIFIGNEKSLEQVILTRRDKTIF